MFIAVDTSLISGFQFHVAEGFGLQILQSQNVTLIFRQLGNARELASIDFTLSCSCVVDYYSETQRVDIVAQEKLEP